MFGASYRYLVYYLQKTNKISLYEISFCWENMSSFIVSYCNCIRIARPKGGLFTSRYHVSWREFISQCKYLVFCPPYLWGKIESQLLLRMGKCRHHLISQDLIWINIVVWNYLHTESMINLAIRLAVFINCISIEIIIQWNSLIAYFRWTPNPHLKHLLSNHRPCDVMMQQISGFVTSWMWCIATVVCCPCKVPPSAAIRPDNLQKYTSSRETNCGKLMNIPFWNFKPSARMSLRV